MRKCRVTFLFFAQVTITRSKPVSICHLRRLQCPLSKAAMSFQKKVQCSFNEVAAKCPPSKSAVSSQQRYSILLAKVQCSILSAKCSIPPPNKGAVSSQQKCSILPANVQYPPSKVQYPLNKGAVSYQQRCSIPPPQQMCSILPAKMQ